MFFFLIFFWLQLEIFYVLEFQDNYIYFIEDGLFLQTGDNFLLYNRKLKRFKNTDGLIAGDNHRVIIIISNLRVAEGDCAVYMTNQISVFDTHIKTHQSRKNHFPFVAYIIVHN